MAGAAAGGIIGMVGGFLGDKMSAQAQKKSAKFNKQVALNNETIARQTSAVDVARIRKRNMRFAAKQKVSASKAGVRISGSVKDVLYDSALEGELSALDREFKGKLAQNQARQSFILAKESEKSANQRLDINPLRDPVAHTKGIFNLGFS